jgi:isopentenyldiphosphate isomerase
MINSNFLNDELIDVVNENDIFIETRNRNNVHDLGLLHREIHVWLFDEEHNIYFQKTNLKKFSGGLFDASIGGHVNKSEEYISAAIRETEEESGLPISPSDLVFLNKFKGISKNIKKGTINNFIRSIYVYKYPIGNDQLRKDERENEGFEKFSVDFFKNMTQKNTLLFHQFILTQELPFVFKYLSKI